MGEWVIKVYVEPLEFRKLSGEQTRNLCLYDAIPHEKLEAAGCPRLAFLFIMREAADPIEDVIATWKLWLVSPLMIHYGMELKKQGVPKIERGGYVSLEELMRVIDSLFFVKSVALFVHTACLWPIESYELEEDEMGTSARELEAHRRYLEAERAVIAEIEKLNRLVESGPQSPEMDEALERFLRDVYSGAIEIDSEEEAREFAERGAKVTESGSGYIAIVSHPDQLPERYRERWREDLFRTLKEFAAMLSLIHSKRLEGYICAQLV